MKRPRNKEVPPWEDPNKLKIPELQQVLSAFGIQYDLSERRSQLFQRYVQLAQVESPESVELWTGQDSLEAPLPAADSLVVFTLRIFLALYAVECPAQASRGHLIKLYNSIPRPRHEGPEVIVKIPPHPEQKKRKTRSNPISLAPSLQSNPIAAAPLPPANPIIPAPAALPCGESNSYNIRGGNIPSTSGKILRKRERQAMISPYHRQYSPPMAAQKNGRISRSSKIHLLSRMSRSLQGVQDDSASTSASQFSLRQKSEPKNRNPETTHEISNNEDETMDSESRVSSVGETSRQPTEVSQLSEAGFLSNYSPQRPPAQEDELVLSESNVPSLSRTSQRLASSRNNHVENNIEPEIPSSSVYKEKALQKSKRASKSLSRRPISQISQSSEGGSLPRCSPQLPEVTEDDLVSSTTEVPSLSGKSRSTPCSERSCNDLDEIDEQSQIPSSSVREIPLQNSIKVSRSISRRPSSEILGSSEGGSLPQCFPRLLEVEDNEAPSSTTDVLSVSGKSRSTRRLDRSRDDHDEDNSQIPQSPVRDESTLPTSSPRSSIVQPILEEIADPLIDGRSSREPSLGVESTTRSGDSESTVVPGRRGVESAACHDSGNQLGPARHKCDISSKESSVSADDQSKQHEQQPDTITQVEESSETDNARGEVDLTQEVIQDESPSHSDTSPTSTAKNPSQPTHKRKVHDDASAWPDASQLSRAEIQAYLDDHDVFYNRQARIARLVTSYNALRSSLQDKRDQLGKRRKTPCSHLGYSVDESLHSTRNPRSQIQRIKQNRRRVVASSEPDDAGFVYTRPELPHDRRPATPAPLSLASGSNSSGSNYEPSVTPTIEPQLSVANLSEPSLSTWSNVRYRGDSPTASTSKKQLTNNRKAKATKGPGVKVPKQPRSQKEKLRQKSRLKRAPPPNGDAQASDANFCPIVPQAQYAPPSNFHDTNLNEINFHLSVPRAPNNKKNNKKHRRSPSPDYANRTTHNASHSTEPLSTRAPRKTTKPGKGKERARRDRYTPHPAYHDVVIPPHSVPLQPDKRLNQLPRYNSSPPSAWQQEPADALNPPQIHGRFVLPRALKRKQPTDLSPQAPSKRQACCLSPVHPANFQLSAQRPHRRQERIRTNSYTPHPSMHDDPILDKPVDVNRSDNVDAWMSSLPQEFDPHSSPPIRPPPPPPQHIHRTDQSTSGQCNCQSKATTVLLYRIADNVEILAAGGHQLVRQTQPTARRRPTDEHRNLSLLAQVRIHIRALFGKCMDLNMFPPAATEREKNQWRREPEDESDDDDDEMNQHPNNENDDPAFPYRNGPGHRDLSAATLAIMWRSMRRVGVVSFRPDLTRGPKDVDNVFLWNLAHSIFIKLVRANEYPDIDLETSSEVKIRKAIFNHATQLARQYREAGWNPNRLDDRAARKRRLERTRRLRDLRIKYVYSRPGLAALIPVITECTSDAETANEDSDSNTDMDNTNQDNPKRSIVQVLPWRHPRLTRAFGLIDRLIELKRQSGCKDFGRSNHLRIRPDEENPIISDRRCPHSLPADCYDSTWLRGQRITTINSLKIQPGPELKPMIQKLDYLVHSQ